MKTKFKTAKYVIWLSAETMHNASKKWLSELEFVKGEQLFFDDLVKSYTIQLIDSENFSKTKNVVIRLGKLQKETDRLIEIIKLHERELKIMVDGIDQIEQEKAYRDKHGALINTVADFLKAYRIMKAQLFALVKRVLKDSKKKKLLH